MLLTTLRPLRALQGRGECELSHRVNGAQSQAEYDREGVVLLCESLSNFML